jgi:pimeloyl-ACP methyl ester carboxylesterase
MSLSAVMESPAPIAGLVLVPGLLCDRTLWAPQLVGLADCVRMWVPDLTACETIGSAVAHILAASPFQRFSLAGLSMGGYLAASIALEAPERVERLALLNTRAHAPDSPASVDRRLQMIALAENGRFSEVVARLMPTLLSAAALAEPDIVGPVEAMSRRLGAPVFIRQQRANMQRADIAPRIPCIRCPTLLIGGTNDAVAPAPAMAELAALLPNAVLKILPGCGHLSTLEQPEQVNALMRDWLVAATDVETP